MLIEELGCDIADVELIEVNAAGDQHYQWGGDTPRSLWLVGRAAHEGAKIGDKGSLLYKPDRSKGLYVFKPQ